MGKFLYLVIYKGDVRSIHGYVTAYSAHGDAHLGPFQSRGVIDAIADHAHRLTCSLILINGLQLVLRQAVGLYRSDFKLSSYGQGSVFMVTGEQQALSPAAAVQTIAQAMAQRAQGKPIREKEEV